MRPAFLPHFSATLALAFLIVLPRVGLGANASAIPGLTTSSSGGMSPIPGIPGTLPGIPGLPGSSSGGGMCLAPVGGNPSNPACGSAPAALPAGGPSTGAGNPINVLTGSKYEEVQELPALPGELGLEWRRSYNSRSSQIGLTGAGWRSSYEAALYDNGRDLQIVQADGRRITFARDPKNPSHCVSLTPGQGRVEIVEGKDGRVDQRNYRWHWPDGRQLSFSAVGESYRNALPTYPLASIRSARGAQLTLIYQGGQLAKVRDPQGRELILHYQGHQLSHLSTPVGELRYQRDPQGRILSARLSPRQVPHATQNPSPSQTSHSHLYHYETAHQSGNPWLLTGHSVQRGNEAAERVATWRYDGNGLAIETRYGSEVLSFDYSKGDRTVVTTTKGTRSEYERRIIGGEFRLSAASGPGCERCPAPNRRYRYDPNGALLVSEAVGSVQSGERYVRDAEGRVLEYWRKDAAGEHLQARYGYTDTPAGRDTPSLIERPSAVTGKWHRVAVSFGEHGQITAIRETGWRPAMPGETAPVEISRQTAFTWGRQGSALRLLSMDGPLPGPADTTRYKYDERGQLVVVTHPEGLTEHFTYDEAGRIRTRKGLDGVTEMLAYDVRGQVERMERAGSVLQLSYNARGKVTGARDALGQVLKLHYDKNGRLEEFGDAQGNRIAWRYSSNGGLQALELLNPDGSVSQRRNAGPNDPTIRARDALLAGDAGALLPDDPAFAAHASPGADRDAIVTRSDSAGRTTTYYLDDFGRMVAEHSPVTGLTRYEWDPAGRLAVRVRADGSTTRIERDGLGRVRRIVAPGEDGRIEWGGANRPLRISYREGEERFTYDAGARLSSHTRLIDKHEFTTRYEYDAQGRLTRRVLPDGTRLGYRYNGRVHGKPGVLSAIVREGLIELPIIADINRAEERFHQRGFTYGNGLTHRRELDVNGQLLRSGNPKAGQSQLAWQDSEVRRASYQHAGKPGAQMAPDVASPLLARSKWQLAQLGSAAPANIPTGSAAGAAQAARFDVLGQQIEDAQHRYLWDGMGRMVQVERKAASGSAQILARYRYNLFGERIAKVVYGAQGKTVTYFFYDGTQLTAEADEQGKLLRQYVHLEGRPVSMLAGRAIHAIHSDHRLAPMSVTDKDRRVVWQASLGEYGAASVQPGSTINMPLRGSNQYYDAETGLHYNTHRYLDANQGRYLSPDPMGLEAGPDLYQFALGQPQRYVDMLGLAPADIKNDADVASAGFGDKLIKSVELALPMIAEAVRNDVKSAFDELLSPTNIATTIAIFAVWQGLHATPIGWIADALMAGLAYYEFGKAGINIIKTFVKYVIQLGTADTCVELKSAAATLSTGLNQVVLLLGEKVNFGGKLKSIFGNSKPATTNITANPSAKSVAAADPKAVDVKALRSKKWQSLDSKQKGFHGELEAADHLLKAKFEPIGGTLDPRKLNNQADVDKAFKDWDGKTGIDGIYKDKAGNYVILESKASKYEKAEPDLICDTKGGLCKTQNGRQLSDDWINKNLEKMLPGDANAAERNKILVGLTNGKTKRVLAKTDENGTSLHEVKPVGGTSKNDVVVGDEWKP